MKKKFYLKNGEEVILNEQLSNGKYLVEKMLCYCDYDGDETTEPSGEEIVVNKIYIKPPLESINKEVLKLRKKVLELQTESTGLSFKIKDFKKEISSHNESVMNFTSLLDADKLTVFCDRKPITFTSRFSSENKLTLKFNFYGKMSYNSILDSAEYYFDGTGIDKDTGILRDASQEEIDNAQRKLLSKTSINYIESKELLNFKNSVLSKELLKKKNLYITSQLEYKIENCNRRIKSYKKDVTEDNLRLKKEQEELESAMNELEEVKKY